MSSAPISAAFPLLAPFQSQTPWGQQAREYLDEARRQLYGLHRQGVSGHAVVAGYTAVMDHLLRALFDAANAEYAERSSRLNQRCALVAQGGYGRRELNPCSDIDLLFLYEHKRDPYVESVAERILYALWDTKVDVGHAMRNVRECARLAAQDFKVKTSLLDARFLCGDEALYQDFSAAMDRDVLKRDADRFFKEKLAETRERHARCGDSVYLLQPQLKEGEGGLRDLHTAFWLAKVKFKTNQSAKLVEKGVITVTEREELEAARDFLWRVRNSLHFLTGKHQDQLTFEYQETVAAELGFEDTATLKGVERFMRQYYLSAASVNRFADQIIDRCLERGRPYQLLGRFNRREIRRGVWIAGQVLSLAGEHVIDDDPTNLIRIFADAQRHGTTVSNATKRLLRARLGLLDDARRRDPRMVEGFFEILRGRARVYDTLLEMHRVGVLGAFLPEFGHLLCMVLRDLYHTYTVDEHSLRGVRELEELRAGKYQDIAPLPTQLMRETDRAEILYLSMILHDIGKGHGSNHPERGAAMVGAIANRLHLNADDATQLEFLVLHHLTMSHLAQRRDIHDQRLLIEFARTVETLDNLQKLYLLTFADMRAVAPKIWNSWHDMLLSELYLGTLDIFEREAFVEEDQLARVDRVKQRIAGAAHPQVGATALAAFLGDMPDRYFLGTAEEAVVHHIDLVQQLDGQPCLSEVKHFPDRAFSEFTVVTRDRPGLFAMITGVLLAQDLNILTASINTSRAGIALDIFRISHGEQPEITLRPARWQRVIETLPKVLAGEQEVEDLVAAARQASPLARKYVPRVPTNIDIDNQISDHFTVLDVYTQDRVGLLFTIANTLYHLGLSIHIAKITTSVDQVLDVFYVTDLANRKIVDPERLDEIRSVLYQGLTARPAPAATAG